LLLANFTGILGAAVGGAIVVAVVAVVAILLNRKAVLKNDNQRNRDLALKNMGANVGYVKM
jgi:hypothetical protein